MMVWNVTTTFDQWNLFPVARLIVIVSNPSLPFLLLSGSGIDGGRGKGDRFARVSFATLHAPRWWLVVSSPAKAARRGDTKSHVGGRDARGRTPCNQHPAPTSKWPPRPRHAPPPSPPRCRRRDSALSPPIVFVVVPSLTVDIALQVRESNSANKYAVSG